MRKVVVSHLEHWQIEDLKALLEKPLSPKVEFSSIEVEGHTRFQLAVVDIADFESVRASVYAYMHGFECGTRHQAHAQHRAEAVSGTWSKVGGEKRIPSTSRLLKVR